VEHTSSPLFERYADAIAALPAREEFSRSDLSLANCYFAHNSSVLLFPVFDLSPNHGINRLHEHCGCLIDRHVQKAGSRGGASHVPQPFVVGRRDVPRTSSRKVGIGFELPTQSSVVAPNAPKKVDQPHWECGLGG